MTLIELIKKIIELAEENPEKRILSLPVYLCVDGKRAVLMDSDNIEIKDNCAVLFKSIEIVADAE